jgi:hypothetical protein
MMTNLGWSALIFAAVAALACCREPEGQTCSEVASSVFAARPCCERHRTAKSWPEVGHRDELEAAGSPGDTAR